ncbi:hypothetical protein CBS147326_9551 [Penicillium roqueforti]|nr:hypothetical protein CBS147326_9551 [Penicillium roqueforti]
MHRATTQGADRRAVAYILMAVDIVFRLTRVGNVVVPLPSNMIIIYAGRPFGWLARRHQTFTSTQTRSNAQSCAPPTGHVIAHLRPTFGTLRMGSSGMWLLPSFPPALLHRGSAKPVSTGCCPKGLRPPDGQEGMILQPFNIALVSRFPSTPGCSVRGPTIGDTTTTQ